MVDWKEDRAFLFTPRNLSSEEFFDRGYVQSALYEALQLCETSAAYKTYIAARAKSKKKHQKLIGLKDKKGKQTEKTLKLVNTRDNLVALDLASVNLVSCLNREKPNKMDFTYLGDSELPETKCSGRTKDCSRLVTHSPTCMSESSTVFSDDYTQITELGDGSDIDLRSPPESASGDDCDSTLEPSDRSSISTISSDLERVTLNFSNLSSNYVYDTEVADDDCADESVTPGEAKSDLRARLTKGFSKMLEESLVAAASGDKSKGDAKQTDFYQDEEFAFLKTGPVKRSTSLKTSKTPPGTPSRKKAVRFADALGLDLEDVRHVLNSQDPPKIPASAMKDLKVGLEEDHKTEGTRYLSACFPQPGASPTFLHRVLDEKVLLENCIISDIDLTVTGTVRVANVSYHKQVVVRYTVNNWITFTDVRAAYVHDSSDGTTDRFSFSLNVPSYFAEGSKLQFALMFKANGQELWDSNTGRNYVIECYAKAVPITEADDTWLHFM